MALYFPSPHQASPRDLEAAAILTRTAAIIISRYLESAESGRAEGALRESEVRFLEFGDASSDVLWIRDTESMAIEYLSPAFEAVYGESRVQALGGDDLQRWTDLIYPEDRAGALASLERVRQGGRVTHEFRIVRHQTGGYAGSEKQPSRYWTKQAGYLESAASVET